MKRYYILQSIISVLIITATIVMIFLQLSIPEWWPPLAVAVVGFLFGRRNEENDSSRSS